MYTRLKGIHVKPVQYKINISTCSPIMFIVVVKELLRECFITIKDLYTFL